MIVFACAVSAQVYFPTGLSTQSGIVRNVPTSSFQLSADTFFTDGNRAFVAAEVPYRYVNQQYNSQRNNGWTNFGSSNQQQQYQESYGTNSDDKLQELVRYANENRRSSQERSNFNNNQWKNSQQSRNNQNENDSSVPFNREQHRAFSNNNNNNNNGNNDAAGYQNNQNNDFEYQNNNNNNNYNGNSNRLSDSNEYNRANRRR